MEILEVKNLTKTYGKGESMIKAADSISFTVPKGQMAAVVGASGSGKSTLLHIIGGVEKPESGNVLVNGTDVYSLSEKELAAYRRTKVGLIYQFYNLLPILNVSDNITLPTLMDEKKPDEKRLAELLELLGLSDRAGHLPSQLSGGQQQRVAIARALFSSPDILLADEPTGNLDSKSSEEIITLLRTTSEQLGQTMLIVTHDEKIAARCDRIITVSDGRIVGDEVTS